MTVWDRVVRALEPFADASLADSCTVTRKVKGARQPGGSYGPDVPTVIAAGVRCRVTPATLANQETMAAESPDVRNAWLVAFWRGQDIQTNDVLDCAGVDADGNAWARRLIAVTPDGPRTYEVLRTVRCTEPTPSGR